MVASWLSLARYFPWPRRNIYTEPIQTLEDCSRELRSVRYTLEEMRRKGQRISNLVDHNALAKHARLRTHLFHTRHGPQAMKLCLHEFMKARRKGAKMLTKRALENFKYECASYAGFVAVILRGFGPDGRESDAPSARLFDVGRMLLSLQCSAELLSNSKAPSKRELTGIIRLLDLLQSVLEQYAGLVNLLEQGDYRI